MCSGAAVLLLMKSISSLNVFVCFPLQLLQGVKRDEVGSPCYDRDSRILLQDLIICRSFQLHQIVLVFLIYLHTPCKLIFIWRNQKLDFFRIVVYQLLLGVWLLLLIPLIVQLFLQIPLIKWPRRCPKLALLENCHNVAHVRLILISDYFFGFWNFSRDESWIF